VLNKASPFCERKQQKGRLGLSQWVAALFSSEEAVSGTARTTAVELSKRRVEASILKGCEHKKKDVGMLVLRRCFLVAISFVFNSFAQGTRWWLGRGLSLWLGAVTDMAFTGHCDDTLGELLCLHLSLRWHHGVRWRNAASRVVKERIPPFRASVARMAGVV
jgi:hypothetical protein